MSLFIQYFARRYKAQARFMKTEIAGSCLVDYEDNVLLGLPDKQF
jgi:hypothetical protein